MGFFGSMVGGLAARHGGTMLSRLAQRAGVGKIPGVKHAFQGFDQMLGGLVDKEQINQEGQNVVRNAFSKIGSLGTKQVKGMGRGLVQDGMSAGKSFLNDQTQKMQASLQDNFRNIGSELFKGSHVAATNENQSGVRRD